MTNSELASFNRSQTARMGAIDIIREVLAFHVQAVDARSEQDAKLKEETRAKCQEWLKTFA